MCNVRVLVLFAAVTLRADTFISKVDGSEQPYRVHLPSHYDASKPMRLDVVLHGKNAKLTPTTFFAAKPHVVTDRIELEVYGRGNNAYRWAGETDVFEAIAAVQAKYKIDPDRIVLRGFSMGGAGTWHLGLHHPSKWAAIEAGAGFTDTIVYAKRTNLTATERAGLHIYDSVDYAANVQLVPTVGYGGELDPQLKASQNIQEAVANLTGLRALWLVGPKTEHKFHPESKAQSEAFLGGHLPRKANERYRFVTYTARYGDGRIEALEEMYLPATLEQRGSAVTTSNVMMLRFEKGSYTIDGQAVTGTVFHKAGGRWAVGEPKGLIKRSGLQGPIDDAFMDRFVSIGEPDAAFAANWKTHMNGQLLRATGPVKDAHLVLWGTPATNPTLAKILPKLPVQWTAAKLTVNGQTFDATTHSLAMIYPNPLHPSKYVVVSSGHSFGGKDFEGTNALLYPRYGDYAVVEKATGAVKLSGYFDSKWQFAAAPTYSKDIAPILQAKCEGCHRPGQIGPFPLTNYKQAAAFHAEIGRVTQARTMPPWSAIPGYGSFQHERRLSDREILTLARWSETGQLEGKASELPTAKKYSGDWALGKPDLVFTPTEEFALSGNGVDVYRCFVLPSGLTEDKFIRALEVRPGNRKIVHHVRTFGDLTGEARKLDAADPAPGFDCSIGMAVGYKRIGLGGWAPGLVPDDLPANTGRRFPAKSDVVMEIHYHKSGKREVDRSSLGIWLADSEKVKFVQKSVPIVNPFIKIPAGNARHLERASYTLAKDTRVTAVLPHMHLLGQEMKMTAVLPDGSERPLVWAKPYDFNWQTQYTFKEPVELPKGTKVNVSGWYNNSESNPKNPSNPLKDVRWGEGTTEEMLVGFLIYVEPRAN